jgi:hypothetical protein
VSYALLLIGNLGPGMDKKEYVMAESLNAASLRARTLAARLTATLNAVPYYDGCARWHMVRDRTRINVAIGKLIAWSHAIHTGGADAARVAVATTLGLTVQGTEPVGIPRIDEVKPPEIGSTATSEYRS